jgi:hypothetical protein
MPCFCLNVNIGGSQQFLICGSKGRGDMVDTGALEERRAAYERLTEYCALTMWLHLNEKIVSWSERTWSEYSRLASVLRDRDKLLGDRR